MTWIELARDIGVFGIVAYIIQRIIDNSSNRNLEKYKQELNLTIRNYQLTLDSDLERYKSELNLHLGKQTSLHEKRLKIIDKMYKKLVHLDSAMRAMTSIQIVIEDAEQENHERVISAQKAFADYSNYFLFQQLYFNKASCDLLENIRKEYFSANWDLFDLKRIQSFTGAHLSEKSYNNPIEKVQNASQRIQNDIPKTLETLREDFRKLLGVT